AARPPRRTCARLRTAPLPPPVPLRVPPVPHALALMRVPRAPVRRDGRPHPARATVTPANRRSGTRESRPRRRRPTRGGTTHRRTSWRGLRDKRGALAGIGDVTHGRPR